MTTPDENHQPINDLKQRLKILVFDSLNKFEHFLKTFLIES